MADSKTKIFGIIGHPIEHSLSPVMHNAVFKEKKLNNLYIAFDVGEKNLKYAIDGAKAAKFCGLNITIPYKISVIKYLDEIDEEAGLINAVNTIKFIGKDDSSEGSDEGERMAMGYNTDGIGAIKAIEKNLNEKIKGNKIFIFGAGGAARAIIFSALRNNAKVSMFNRTREKSVLMQKEIKEKLNKEIKVVENFALNEELKDSDIIINATSVGMFPDIDKSIINECDKDGINGINGINLPEGRVVMDIVYNPIETKFLKFAKKRNCKVINGVDMLVYQGAESLKIWLDINIDEYLINLMRKAVMNVLKKC